MAKVPNGIETSPKISTGWVGCKNVTDDRQTDRRRTGDNSERSLKRKGQSQSSGFTFVSSRVSHLYIRRLWHIVQVTLYGSVLGPYKCDVLHKPTRSQMLLIRFCCHCSLNTEMHSAKSAMVKAISGHSSPKCGMATAIAAIPVAPPMTDSAQEELSDCSVEISRYRAQWIWQSRVGL